ncbi:MAG: SRPBCC domain-containing protein [Bacteroidales bacterium]|nr:SRPBCC domain-containing protein [Bacteroidales bacterium]
MKSQYELEYTLNSSPKVLFSRLSTAEGLAEWFADDVQVEGNVFVFIWNNTEHRAKLVQLRENKNVRFKWTEKGDEEDRYFEFRLNIDELTGDVALLITDFADEDDKEDAINLWDTQITELKRTLGL